MAEKRKRIIYYSDELNDEFSTPGIKTRIIDEKYDYGDDRISWRIKSFFALKIFAKPLAFLFLKIKYHHKIIGKEKLKFSRGDSYFIFANHTNQIADPLIPAFVTSPNYMYVIVHPNNVSIPVLGKILPYLGALPLPDTMGATKNFLNTIKLRVEKNHPVVIYPEAHIWPYYTKIRPFVDNSFRFPLQYKKASYCFTNTYQKRKFSKKVNMVTYIDGPFFADQNLTLKEQRKNLRDKVYEAMNERSKLNTIELIKYVKKEAKND